MLTFTDDVIRQKIKTDLKQNADHLSFLPFPDLKQSVLDDVEFLNNSGLVLDVPVTGYIYDVKTGRIEKV